LTSKINSYNKPGAIIIEGHVQGLSNTRSLGEAGIPVFVVDKTDCITRYSKYCRKFFLCPDFTLDKFADFLIDLAKKESIKDWVLIPSNDHAVFTISRHKKQLEVYYKIITPDLEIIKNIYDKSKLLKLAEQIHIPVPKTYYFNTAFDILPQDLEFPVITKGRYGLSFYKAMRKKVFLAFNEKELRMQLNKISCKYNIPETFTQELIPSDKDNRIISFTAFCEKGEIKTYWMGIKLREHPIRFGTATFAESVYEQDCYKHSVPLIKILNYTGVCEIEFLKDPRDGKFKLIEINARTWLWVGLAKVCGINYAVYIYKFMNGEKLSFPGSYKLNIQWFNLFTDIIFSLIAILKGEINLLSYIRSYNKEGVEATWNRQDIKPFFIYLFLAAKFLKNR